MDNADRRRRLSFDIPFYFGNDLASICSERIFCLGLVDTEDSSDGVYKTSHQITLSEIEP
jgi:hypothetical protein